MIFIHLSKRFPSSYPSSLLLRRVIFSQALRVRADNHRAITLYKLKGFVVEGTLKNEIFINETYYDNLWMGLEI